MAKMISEAVIFDLSSGSTPRLVIRLPSLSHTPTSESRRKPAVVPERVREKVEAEEREKEDKTSLVRIFFLFLLIVFRCFDFEKFEE